MDSRIEQLVEMGFPADQAARALSRARNDWYGALVQPLSCNYFSHKHNGFMLLNWIPKDNWSSCLLWPCRDSALTMLTAGLVPDEDEFDMLAGTFHMCIFK